MADTNNTFDSAPSTDLFCNEETKSFCFFDFDDDFNFFEPLNHQVTHQTNTEKDLIFSNKGSSDSEALMINYLPCLSEECVGFMVEREKEYLPRNDYVERLKNGELDISLRKEALDWIFKACAHYNFGDLCLYSAITYFDRFLSIYGLPLEKGGKNWAVQLVAVACLSLAAKIEEVNVPNTLDIQAGVPKFMFEAKTIQRMEILVLNNLNWKIKAYTPCNFIDYYLRKMNAGEFPSEESITKSIKIILSTIEGIEFLDFRPSEIAAAVAVYVSGDVQEMDMDKALFGIIDKGRVMECLKLIQELISNSGINSRNVGNLPLSPNGIIEAACLSYKSDERTVESCPSSSHTSPDTKRRKLDKTPHQLIKNIK